jgi:hypothetical protein
MEKEKVMEYPRLISGNYAYQLTVGQRQTVDAIYARKDIDGKEKHRMVAQKVKEWGLKPVDEVPRNVYSTRQTVGPPLE